MSYKHNALYLQSQLYMMDQEKRRLELEVGRLKVQKQMSDRKVDELLQHVNEKRRKEKKRSKRKVLTTYYDT